MLILKVCYQDFENMTVSMVNDTFTVLNLSAADTTFNLITSQTSGFVSYATPILVTLLNQNTCRRLILSTG